jgi:hypothetical protein
MPSELSEVQRGEEEECVELTVSETGATVSRSGSNKDWIADTAASSHFAYDRRDLHDFVPLAE